MKLPPILQKIHNKATLIMSDSWLVENVLIAKVTDENGKEYDCIYCTIIRNALLFMGIGFVLGLLFGELAWL